MMLRNMLLSTLLFLSGTGSVVATASPTQINEQSLDNIVAAVNDTVITQTELNQSVQMTRAHLAATNVTPPPDKALRKQVLQYLIDEKIQLAVAEQSGVQIENAELDKTVNQIAKDNNLSREEFYKKIKSEGMSVASYRKQIRDTLMLQHLQQRDVAANVSVSPEEIAEAMHSTSQSLVSDKEYHIQDVLVSVSDSPSPQEIAIARKFAQDVFNSLHKGTRLSDLPSAETRSLQDNDLGWRKLAEVPTAFVSSVTRMKLNDFYGPIQTSNGFHILHLIEWKDLSSQAKPVERQEVAQLVFQRKFEEARQDWLAKIRTQAFIEVYDKAIA